MVNNISESNLVGNLVPTRGLGGGSALPETFF
jgi:hypothetical protein